MSFLHAIHMPYVVSGFGVGLLVGLTGVGGGSLMTPLLILLFGIHPVTAVGTDLLYAAATKTGGSFVQGYNRTIDWRIVGRLASGSVPAAILTLLILNYLDINSATANLVITKVLGVALLLTAAALILRRWLLAQYVRRVGKLGPILTHELTILTGAVLGVLVSVSSVGAGALGVTALILLYPELPIVRIVASDITHAVPLTLVAGAGHWLLGSIDFALLGSLLVGSLPGIILGSYLAPRVPDTTLRLILAATLVVVAIRLLVQ
jgi:uncharacterized membrane protein YfcA